MAYPGTSSGELIGGRLAVRHPSPVLEADGRDWEAFLASRSRNFREQVRRRERKLAREHDLRFRLSDDPERLDADLDTLFRLHDARWSGDTRSFDPPLDAFHRDFARAALDRGWLRLWLLELDGRQAAAWLGYRCGGAEWYYQAGRDPALEREAVGFVLMNHTIREALNDGMREYRLLLGGESYKDRFANADHGLETVMLRARCPRTGGGGGALGGAPRAAERAPPNEGASGLTQPGGRKREVVRDEPVHRAVVLTLTLPRHRRGDGEQRRTQSQQQPELLAELLGDEEVGRQHAAQGHEQRSRHQLHGEVFQPREETRRAEDAGQREQDDREEEHGAHDAQLGQHLEVGVVGDLGRVEDELVALERARLQEVVHR